MSQPVIHLNISRTETQGATLAIIPGDPARVARIAKLLDKAEPIGQKREFTSYRGFLDGKPVVVCSTGIGGPSTSICVEELAELGVNTFLRVGTTGAIQPTIELGDLIIVNAAVRLDGASLHFAPEEFPAVSDFFVTQALVEAASAATYQFHVGVAASSDTFYPGQERYNTYTGRVTRRFRGSLAEWQALGVLNYEMETATLFTMCQAMGLRSGCVAGVIAKRTASEGVAESELEGAEDRAIRTVVTAAQKLLT